MCGIVGIIKNGDITKKEFAEFKNLLLAAETRGKDATGAAYIMRSGEVHILKTGARASSVVDFLPYRSGICALLGHTRLGTGGSAYQNENNHPHTAGDWVLVHNGVVSSSRQNLACVSRCDTEEIVQTLASIDKEDTVEIIKAAFPYISGSFSLAFYNKRTKEVFLTTNGKNPLHIVRANRTVYFGSTEIILQAAPTAKAALQVEQNVITPQDCVLYKVVNTETGIDCIDVGTYTYDTSSSSYTSYGTRWWYEDDLGFNYYNRGKGDATRKKSKKHTPKKTTIHLKTKLDFQVYGDRFIERTIRLDLNTAALVKDPLYDLEKHDKVRFALWRLLESYPVFQRTYPDLSLSKTELTAIRKAIFTVSPKKLIPEQSFIKVLSKGILHYIRHIFGRELVPLLEDTFPTLDDELCQNVIEYSQPDHNRSFSVLRGMYGHPAYYKLTEQLTKNIPWWMRILLADYSFEIVYKFQNKSSATALIKYNNEDTVIYDINVTTGDLSIADIQQLPRTSITCTSCRQEKFLRVPVDHDEAEAVGLCLSCGEKIYLFENDLYSYSL